MPKYRRQEKAQVARRTTLSAKDRADWARKKWREDRTISINGANGMYRMMMKVFGVALKEEQLVEIHAEIAKEQREADKATRERERNFNPVLSPVRLAEVKSAQAKAADVPPSPGQMPKPPRPEPAPQPMPVFMVRPPVITGPLAETPIMQMRSGQNGTAHVTPTPSPAPHRVVGRNAKGQAVREAWARENGRPGLTILELVRKTRDHFGAGIDGRLAATILSDLRGGARRAHYGQPRASHDPNAKPAAETLIAHARAIARPTITSDTLDAEVKEKFGVGIGRRMAEQIMAEMRGVNEPPPRTRATVAQSATATSAPQASDPSPLESGVGAQVKAVMQLAFDEIKNLQGIKATRDRDGVAIEWQVLEVTTGKLRL
jgi:hypothetical protein